MASVVVTSILQGSSMTRVASVRRATWAFGVATACASGGAGRAVEMGPGWSRGPVLPEPIQENHAAVLHGRIYTAGGFHRGGAVSSAVYRLDPVAGRWDEVAKLPAGRHHMPLAVVGDSLYAVGGLGPDGFGAA